MPPVLTAVKRLHQKLGRTGKLDIVFPRPLITVFIDGDFGHGYRFPAWKHKVAEFWQKKIETNRRRDQRNFRKLRRMGWRVIRIWQHEIKRDSEGCVDRIVQAVEAVRHERTGSLQPYAAMAKKTAEVR